MNSIKPLHNRKIVEDFMHLPEIWRYAAPPGAHIEQAMTSDNPQEFWLGFFVNGVLSGIIKTHVETGSMAQFHPYILSAKKSLFKSMCLDYFKWMKANMPPELLKLNAVVPIIFKKTIDVAKDAKMQVEGTDTLSYRHRFGVCDRVLLGIKMVDI